MDVIAPHRTLVRILERGHLRGWRGSAVPVDSANLMRMAVRVVNEADRVAVYVSGEVDVSCAVALYGYLRGAREDADGLPVLVDMADVTFIDSAGVFALAKAHEAGGGRVRVSNPHRNVKRILDITMPGVDLT